MAHPVADIFRQAAAANRDDARRRGNVVSLAGDDQVLYSGDLHGHRGNLGKIIAAARLGKDPQVRLVIQEVIHGPLDADGLDRSLSLLMRVARLKLAHPVQVLFLLANHDVAQITGNEITKAGLGVCEAFARGVRDSYGDDADEVIAGMNEFLLSMPLAIRCPNGVWMSHSLPSPARQEIAGLDVLDRPTALEDLPRGRPVYEWTWGRGHTPEQIESLAAQLGVSVFLLAHRHCENGYEVISSRCLTVLSDHAHGCVVRFGASEPLTGEMLQQRIVPIASLPSA
ncbi:MAG: hypothetical protein NTV86_17235 [Planctomycetota bacterium]|nr:hypothetical protein [Planctomycetota bacterium]